MFVLYLQRRLQYDNVTGTLHPRLAVHLNRHVRAQMNLYVTALRYSHPVANARLYLTEMHDPSDAHHFQHSVVVVWLVELVFLVRGAPWVRS